MRPHPRRILLSLALTGLVGLGAGPAGSASAEVLTIPFGAPGDLPVVGRWTGDVTTFIGVYRPSTSTFLLRTQNSPGPPDLVLPFGDAGDLPVVGHWCFFGSFSNLADKPTVYRPSTNTFFLPCTNEHLVVFSAPFGAPGDLPVAGNWDRGGTTRFGLYRPSTNTFFLANSAALSITPLGAPGDVPVIRDFFLSFGASFIGVYRPSTSTFFLSDSNTAPMTITVIPFGAMGDLPLLGDWTGDGVVKVGVYRPSTNTFFLKTTFP